VREEPLVERHLLVVERDVRPGDGSGRRDLRTVCLAVDQVAVSDVDDEVPDVVLAVPLASIEHSEAPVADVLDPAVVLL
jgi:hypothetical protein